jgi:hypothetical protein
MSPGLVGSITVDRLIEQAEKQWEMQDHPGWDILEDDDAFEASPVGSTGGKVQLSSRLPLFFSHFCTAFWQTSALITQALRGQCHGCVQKLCRV